MKAKHLCGLGWVLLASISGILGCADEEMPGIDEPVSNSQQEDDEEVEPNEFPFPKLNTSFEIRTLLYGNQQPSASELNACFEEISSMSENALNSQSMREAKGSLNERMESKETVYHWCFFHILHQVDQKLESTEPSLLEKSNFFLQQFKKAWILGSALDLKFEQSLYFNFVRKRYIKLNQQYFGRNLESSTPPFSDSLSLPGKREQDSESESSAAETSNANGQNPDDLSVPQE